MHRTFLAVCLALSACAGERVAPLSADATHVRQINTEQGLACTFLKSVDYDATLRGVGKSDEVMREAGETGLRNVVAAAGGNAYVNTRLEEDSFWGHVHYAGQAFKCPTGPGTALQ